MFHIYLSRLLVSQVSNEGMDILKMMFFPRSKLTGFFLPQKWGTGLYYAHFSMLLRCHVSNSVYVQRAHCRTFMLT
jgi:hypothetical protein